jgi:hypothetical protein
MTRIIIAGSRSYNNYGKLKARCTKIIEAYEFANIEIVSGGAKGADQMGEWFAKERGYPVRVFKADWSIGKSAGYIRNEQMASYAKEDLGVLIAFHDGESRGTKHMIDIARRQDLQVFVEIF